MDAEQRALLPCPWCGEKATIFSNRDWHRLIVDHAPQCFLSDTDPQAWPATDESKVEMITAWNTRALTQAQPGWRAVPVEATPEMLAAGDYAGWWSGGANGREEASDVYAAMLAAAPAPHCAPRGC